MANNGTTPTTPADRKRAGAICFDPRCVATTRKAGGKVYVSADGREGVQHGRGKNRDRAARKVRIVEREGGRCAWCGCHITPETCEADRVDEGGRYALRNVVAACKPCNRERSDTPADVYAARCADPARAAQVLAYVPGGCH